MCCNTNWTFPVLLLLFIYFAALGWLPYIAAAAAVAFLVWVVFRVARAFWQLAQWEPFQIIGRGIQRFSGSIALAGFAMFAAGVSLTSASLTLVGLAFSWVGPIVWLKRRGRHCDQTPAAVSR